MAAATVPFCLPSLQGKSPSDFTTLGQLYAEVCRVDSALARVQPRSREAARLWRAKLALVGRISGKRAKDVRALALKLLLFTSVLEAGDVTRADRLLTSLERDLASLEATA